MRRATNIRQIQKIENGISIHALLAESDPFIFNVQPRKTISIHALLAESDRVKSGQRHLPRNFYPRSPCGERRCEIISIECCSLFLSTLSLRRATYLWRFLVMYRIFLSTLSLRRATQALYKQFYIRPYFYPRSPCGERRTFTSLFCGCFYFYPRSPCGERRDQTILKVYGYGISIHALLAESDTLLSCFIIVYVKFLSTLSLRRATAHVYQLVLWVFLFLSTLSLRRATANWFDLWGWAEYFYPRSPCGERHHILEDTSGATYHFYPRSPCGERQRFQAADISVKRISIHALLAESDPPAR